MNEEMRIDELLNSYVDGELSVRQRTEVKRMAANDPRIAKRLRQLQKCRVLVSALPVANAPSDIMENVRASLEGRNHSQVETSAQSSPNAGFALFRRVLAAAAMISIAVVLVVVINMLKSAHQAATGGAPVRNVADMRFSGKLELKTNDFKAVNLFISKAIENGGLDGASTTVKEYGRVIYTINCSKEGLNSLLSDLNANWEKLYSADLSVDTNVFGQSVEIKAITPTQIEKIMNQADESRAIEVARNIAVANSISKILPDNNSSMNIGSGLIGIPEPVLLGGHNLPTQQDNGKKTVQLRIILSR